ncbi:questin oxidase family protein [Actinoplanes sp. G11-F43]|uniref:questin oxidase family protein n=1 Tax=Actinoplanes sp. G11-F43 TaxID=3424130 RepID=UPI003D32C303
MSVDEVYERLRHTGPERDGWLSNHAPMAAEALIRHGQEAIVHRWLDGYADRLEARPRGISPILPAQWREPLGDPTRTGDWLTYFDRELALAPWPDVLVTWWPRLLPGIAAGATHGVIRVGHAVRSLLDATTPARVGELAQGLAYWAGRWQPLAPPGAGPYPATDPRSALDAVPRVPDQRSGARERLAQLARTPGWAAASGNVPGPDTASVRARLEAIVEAATLRHGTHGHASPIMLVHAATAPNAVLRVLPVLPSRLWPPSLEAAWTATAAITAAYSPAEPRPLPAPSTVTPGELIELAARSGDEHAIKFADTALDLHPRVLASARHSVGMF